MRNLVYLLLAGSLLAFSACEDGLTAVVNIDPPEFTPQMVFHTLLDEQDSTVRVVMSRNIGILEEFENDAQWQLRNATVEWWQNGQKVFNLSPISTDSSFVYSAVLPQGLQTGQTYEIRASHPDFEPVVARQTMPAAVNADSAKLKLEVSTNQFSGVLHQAEISINDEPGVENFYEISIAVEDYILSYTFNPDGTFTIDTLGTYISNQYFDNFFDQNIKIGTANGALVSDQFFDGQRYKFIGQFAPNYWSSNGDTRTYYLRVNQVTKDYYQWSRSYIEHADNEFNVFAEPVPVFTNVENGLGIFSLKKGRVFELK